jgi:hypothetical protein
MVPPFHKQAVSSGNSKRSYRANIIVASSGYFPTKLPELSTKATTGPLEKLGNSEVGSPVSEF